MLRMLFFISLLSSLFLSTHSYTQCLHHQKTLLLQLKDELIFDSSTSTKLVQWNERDECCKWYGVECDAAGYVLSLQLNDESISGGIGDSSSLFRLEYLHKLNLANNKFNSTPIPKGIHNLSYLTHLNLSYAGFGGQVPAELLSLRRLISLDISNEFYNLKLEYPNLEMVVQNLTGLRELYLDGVNITSSRERRKWSQIIPSYLPNLTALSLCDCDLSGPFATSFSQFHSLSILRLDYNNLNTTVPDFFANFSSLTTLTLSGCSLNGYFPSMILQIPTLQNLDLSGNKPLCGSLPPFPQIGSLKSIRLSLTNFSGLIPTSINNLKTLVEIDFSFCRFTGSLSSRLFGGLSNLVYLDLGFNSFTGYIPRSLFGLPSLQTLMLNENQFIGQLEEFPIVNASSIVYLDLRGNRLQGPIPNSFFQLLSLNSLLLSGNLFNGTFQLKKIQSLVNLTYLDLSYNNLSVDIGDNSSSTYGLPQLTWLHLASCNMSDFPHFLKHSDIRDLDLSNNRIVGEIPSWIWGKQLQLLNLSLNHLTDFQKPYHIPVSLSLLDLQSNQLRGELHLPIHPNIDLSYLSLGNNSFNGSIPTSLCSATALIILDLSVNKLSGSIPSCLLENLVNLKVLDLGRNNISGHIPDIFSVRCSLEYLDLNNNTLEGKIPKSLERCMMLEFMNVGNNIINDTFPCMLQSPSLHVLVLHFNKFHGEVRCHNNIWAYLQILDISSNNFSGSLESINFSSWTAMSDAQWEHNELSPHIPLGTNLNYKVGVFLTMKGSEMKLVKIFRDFTVIDFSCNNFQGEIPNVIGDLSSLRLLNLSCNALNGSIPKSFGKLGELESLDLSRNQLAGEIPTELAGLTFLSVLNLSYNKLVGKIPNGRQLQTFSAESFKGNPGLCGFNLEIDCSHHGVSPREDDNGEEKREIEWEYVCAALGYVVGLGSIVWLLLFCRSFREKYFGKIEDVVQEMFDARDRRRRRALRNHRVRRQ